MMEVIYMYYIFYGSRLNMFILHLRCHVKNINHLWKRALKHNSDPSAFRTQYRETIDSLISITWYVECQPDMSDLYMSTYVFAIISLVLVYIHRLDCVL